MMLYLVFAYLAAVNLIAVVLFGLDQIQARGAQKRIPPATLLVIAFIGGWPGAKLAQRIFQHCPTTKSFYRLLNGVPVMWMAAVFAVVATSTFAPRMTAPDVAQNVSVERETPKFFSSISN